MILKNIAGKGKAVRHMLIRSLLAAVALSASASLQAQDWRFAPLVRIGGEFDDNAELSTRTDEEIELNGILLNAAATIDYNSPSTFFTATPRFVWRRYSDDPDLESNDMYLRSVMRHQLESSTVGFRLKYDNQSVRTAERADTDLEIEEAEDIENDDSGRVTVIDDEEVIVRGDRHAIRIAPFWDYSFSDRSTLSTQVSYRQIIYADEFTDLLQDFDDLRGEVSYRYNATPRTTAIVRATGRRFETESGDNESTGAGGLVGFERSFTENTTLRAMVGVESAERNNLGSESAAVGEFTIIRRLETIRLLAGYNRAITGTGAGRLSVRDAFNLNFTRQLNDKVAAGLGVRAYQSRGLGASQDIDDRDYVQLRANFTWYVSQAYSFEFDYRYTTLNRVEVGERANSNNVNLWFAWHPNRNVN